jgi:hypothetical protein
MQGKRKRVYKIGTLVTQLWFVDNLTYNRFPMDGALKATGPHNLTSSGW